METKFQYKGLEGILTKLNERHINSVEVRLLISLNRASGQSEIFKNVINDLARLVKNKKIVLKTEDGEKEFNVEQLNVEVGDVLNKYMHYYGYCEDYLVNNGLTEEDEIPENTRKVFKEIAVIAGRHDGDEWLRNNIQYINEIIPEDQRKGPDLKIGELTTRLADETETTPEINFISYQYWLSDPLYGEKERILKDLYNMNNSLIKRALEHEANYFYDRSSVRKKILMKDFFIRESIKYLFDETVSVALKYINTNNNIEFYWGGREGVQTQVFKGKAAHKDPVLKELFKNELKGIDERRFVSIQEKTIDF